VFIIKLNQIEGVELILNALRERYQYKGCVASGDLADGIERYLIYEDSEGNVLPHNLQDTPDTVSRPTFGVIKGGKDSA
jgi:hypothetical protein